MTEEEFQKDIEWAIKRAEELRRQLEAGEIELPSITLKKGELITWPLWEISLTRPPFANPVTIMSPMEYSHDDKDKGTK